MHTSFIELLKNQCAFISAQPKTASEQDVQNMLSANRRKLRNEKGRQEANLLLKLDHTKVQFTPAQLVIIAGFMRVYSENSRYRGMNFELDLALPPLDR